MNTAFTARLSLVVAALSDQLAASADLAGTTAPVLEVQPGRRYVRIVATRDGATSAYAFVDSTNGDLLKPASFKIPATHARGNIYADDMGLTNCGLHGVTHLKRGRKPSAKPTAAESPEPGADSADSVVDEAV